MTIPGTLEQWVAFLLDSTIKSSVVLLIAFGVTFALRKRSASLLHLVWSIALTAAIALPFFTLALPQWHSTSTISTMTLLTPPSEWTPLSAAQPSALGEAVPSETPPATDRSAAVIFIWLGGCILAGVLLFREVARLMWIAGRAEPFFNSRWRRMADQLSKDFAMPPSVRFLQNRTASMLVTWGVLSPRVLLPIDADQWSENRMRAVLGHELAHIRRHDWFIQLVTEFTRAIYWFNPLVWIACNRLRLECERACDDAVIGLGVDSTEYATELLALARSLKNSHKVWTPSLAMARTSTLERRFAAMLNPLTDRRGVTTRTVLVTLLISLCLVLPLAAMQTPVQIQTGRLFGRVYDPSGKPIRNATITVYDTVKNTRDMTSTNANGVFEFARLPIGQYELQTSATGYENFQIREVNVDANQEVSLNILTVASPALPEPASPSPNTLPKPAQQQLQTRVAADVQAAKLLRRVAPVFPPAARANQTQGAVVLDALIDKEGKPSSLRVINNIDPELAKAAVDAVKQWQYRPTLLNGEPVEVATTITTSFAAVSPSTPSVFESSTPRPTPPPPPPPPPPPSRIRQGGNVQQAMLLTQVKPVYPLEAKEARIQGVVVLEVVIGKDGLVSEVRIITGHPTLQQAAVDSVRQWQYKPTLLNGEPVEVVSTVTVNFAFQE